MLPLLNDLPVGVTKGSLSTSDGGVTNRAPEESMLLTQDHHSLNALKGLGQVVFF